MSINDFLKDWDDCIASWYKNNLKLTGRMEKFKNLSGLAMEYLPEPYYGDPENCSAVVININPGSSSPLEQVKKWENPQNPNNELIFDYANRYQLKYSDFQSAYSPFVAPSWVPGVTWWANNRNMYIERIVNLYRKEKNLKESNRKPFALELCPLHSATTNGLKYTKRDYFETYKKNVFIPAAQCLKSADIPFGLCFASSIGYVMKMGRKNDKMFDVLNEWDHKSGIPGWPTDSNGNPLAGRKYAFLKGVGAGVEGSYFLNTWNSKSRAIIKLTTKVNADYAAVDEFIVKEIAKII